MKKILFLFFLIPTMLYGQVKYNNVKTNEIESRSTGYVEFLDALKLSGYFLKFNADSLWLEKPEGEYKQRIDTIINNIAASEVNASGGLYFDADTIKLGGSSFDNISILVENSNPQFDLWGSTDGKADNYWELYSDLYSFNYAIFRSQIGFIGLNGYLGYDNNNYINLEVQTNNNSSQIQLDTTGLFYSYPYDTTLFTDNHFLTKKCVEDKLITELTFPCTKWHRTDTINTSIADTWCDVKFNDNAAIETTYGFTANSDSTGFVSSIKGLFKIGGCGHWKWNGGDSGTVKVYIRVIVNEVEKRCLQSNDSRTNLSGDDGTLPYSGTILVHPDDIIKVQYRVDNTNLDFEGNTAFDYPVSFSFYMFKISNTNFGDDL